jgi:methylthioribose-1-phosphate isomerase
MNVDGKPYRTIWLNENNATIVQIIDQRQLPFEFVIEDLVTVDDVATAIQEMHVRGAGLIGATAGYGMYIAALTVPRGSTEAFVTAMEAVGEQLKATRPTAVNLEWAVIASWMPWALPVTKSMPRSRQ